MKFTNSRPDIVRSISQRWLLNSWTRLRGKALLPQFQSLEAMGFEDLSASLSFTDIIGTDGGARFLIRFHGQRIAEAYGAICEGRFLDEILPAAFRDAALATYLQVLAERRPVYTVANTHDRNGLTVHYERLLLPFGRDGTTVDRILASLETVSPNGAFEHRDLMKAPANPPAFALCATIQP